MSTPPTTTADPTDGERAGRVLGSPPAGSRPVWLLRAALCGFVAALVAFGATRALDGGGDAAAQAPTDTAAALPVIKQVPGGVPEPGTPVGDLAAGTASVGADGKTYGAMPTAGLPTRVDGAAIAPDYIAVIGSDGLTIAGYAKQGDMFPTTPTAADNQDKPSPGVAVWAADGTTLVGHLVPNKGFIPTGVDPDSVPTPAERAATERGER